MDTSESRLETREKFQNVVLEKYELNDLTDHARNKNMLQRVKEERDIQ